MKDDKNMFKRLNTYNHAFGNLTISYEEYLDLLYQAPTSPNKTRSLEIPQVEISDWDPKKSSSANPTL